MANHIKTMNEKIFSHAVTHWINGNEVESCRLLSQIQTGHARNLLALIHKPVINVLAQLPWIAKGTQDLLSGAELDPKFKVNNIGFKTQDIQNCPYANVHDFYDQANPPDFYIAQMLEWHPIAPNIQELPCPIFGQTSDYDLHLQAIHPWLRLFDELIVNGPDEQQEVTRLSGRPVTAFPKTFSIPDSLPPIPDKGSREIDFFMSGTVFHPYHIDKAALVNCILEQRDLNTVIYNGFISQNAYYDLLTRSKLSISFVRHADTMPTRGLEALAMGCVLLVQQESVLNQYLAEEHGVVTYDYRNLDSIKKAILKVLTNWDYYEEAARRGAALVRKEFTVTRVASQFLRFMTVLASKPRPTRVIQSDPYLDQKRNVLVKGWRYPLEFNDKLQNINLDRWASRLENIPSVVPMIEIGRELALDLMMHSYWPVARQYAIQDCPKDAASISRMIHLLDGGTRRFSDSLVLAFNAARVALHFGLSSHVSWARDLMRQIVSKPAEHWQVEPLHDVMPWDFFSQMFNYRGYFDEVTELIKGTASGNDKLKRLILASAHYYLSFYEDKLQHLERAVGLDPVFDFYSYRFAQAVIEQRDESRYELAVRGAVRLAGTSMLFQESFALVERFVGLGVNIPEFGGLQQKCVTADVDIITQTLEIENWLDPCLRHTSTHNASVCSDAAQPVLPKVKKILFIHLDFLNWKDARGWTFSSNLAMVDALRQLGHEVTVLPAMHNISPRYPASWLYRIKEICAQVAFDQVWIELVHLDPEESFLEFIAATIPVRVALLPESLEYDETDYALYPSLRRRRMLVESRLRFMTHALAVDEQDAARLNKIELVKSLWKPEAVPARFISDRDIGERSDQVVFMGSVYGARRNWLEHPALAGLMSKLPSPDDVTPLPQLFNAVNGMMAYYLDDGRPYRSEQLSTYLDVLYSIRLESFSSWMKSLQVVGGVVNLPGTTKAYGGRVFEAMAAGCAVFSWRIAGRSVQEKLFDDDKIILFDPDKPLDLADKIENTTPERLREIGRAAQDEIRRAHTVEIRMQQVLAWIDTGLVPDYNHPPQSNLLLSPHSTSSVRPSVDNFYLCMSGKNSPARLWLRPASRRADIEMNEKAFINALNETLAEGDAYTARSLLEEIVEVRPEYSLGLSRLCLNHGETQGALEQGLFALSKNPYSSDSLLNCFEVAEKLGHVGAAKQFLDDSLQYNVNSSSLSELIMKRKFIHMRAR